MRRPFLFRYFFVIIVDIVTNKMFKAYIDFLKSDNVILIGKYFLVALIILLPIVIPIMLIYRIWTSRFRYITMKFVEEQKPLLLEIRLPKEITKSPAAMEIFFSYLAQGGASTYAEAFIDGKTKAWFSCEIVSIGGVVKFFVWCSQAKLKNTVESQLYAQYPNVEIFEAEDYTRDFYYDSEKYSMNAAQFALTKPDPYPIKTYIDYGLDNNPKEEYKIDPITPVIEYLGSLKNGENAWIQILIQKHESESWKHGVLLMDDDPDKAGWFKKILINLLGSSKKLKNEIKTEIEKVRKSTIPEGDASTTLKIPNPTKGQLNVIAALERSATKNPFDCMIRSVYIAEKNSFVATNIGGLLGCLKQYSSNDLNGFKPDVKPGVSDLRADLARILPFLKKKNEKEINETKEDLFNAYKLRSYFQLPYKNYGDSKPFVLTTEELATIFHFPSGMVSQTPTLERVGSKKSEAPSNLPI